MKRIIGTVVALAAVLAFGTAANAAIINLTGPTWFGTASSLAPIPPGYFQTFVGPNSYAVVDITGSSVELAGGTLRTTGSTDLGAYGTFISDVTTRFWGATGTLTGEDITWTTGATFHTDPLSTFGCTGAICSLLGIDEGTTYPIAVYQAFTAALGVVAVPSVQLGVWDFTGPNFLSPNLAVTATSAGQTASWYVFGGTVPEPGAFVLIALGLGALSLRGRKA